MGRKREKTGLAFWADRVLKEVVNVGQTFEPDPVHDLRVALRRCRSIADGFRAVDPEPRWKELKQLAKDLFSRLGDLRDVQIMEEWVSKLSEPDDPACGVLIPALQSQEQQLKKIAQSAVEAFDCQKWSSLATALAVRTRQIPVGGLVFQHIATERWEQARQLHREALRNRTQVAFHRLRIGLKKFRYTVENFLPRRHPEWGPDLRQLQDILGEIHDLDVLAAIIRKQPAFNPEQRGHWLQKIGAARQTRVQKYREMMLGQHSLWGRWRAGLPAADRLADAALARLKTWAAFLDPDFEHSLVVTDLALQLHDGLVAGKVLPSNQRSRRILKAAALLHDVGRAKGKRGHQKDSYRLIRKLAVPLSWSADELSEVAAVARYHRGALPRPDHKCLQRLPMSARPGVVRLAGVLRLADGLDFSHDKLIRQLRVERNNGTVIVHSAGYSGQGPEAERVAAARYLLEASCDIAVLVRPSQRNQAQSTARKAESAEA